MISIIGSVDVLKRVFEMLKALKLGEVEFVLTENGFEGISFDAPHITCAYINIDSNAFDKMEGEGRIRFDVKVMSKVMTAFPYKEKVKITIGNQCTIVSLTGKKKVMRFNLLVPSGEDIANPDKMIADIIKTTVTVDLDELMDGIKQAMIFAENIQIQVTGNEIMIGGAGDTGSSLLEFLRNIKKQETFKSTFKGELLVNVIKAGKKISKQGTLGIGNDAPFCLKVSSDNLLVSLYVAPIVEAESK